jgi:squalene synthase HpnC
MSFRIVEELSRWGPQGTDRGHVVSVAEAEVYCRRLATGHYENFPLVSWLLPRGLHQHFYNVYAYCRWADDLGDEVGDVTQSLALLAWWRTELQRCFAGDVQHPVFIALQETVRTFQMPLAPFDDLISAFEQDQTQVEYATFADLRDYCRRSADPVGRLVLRLCGCDRPELIGWSDSICTGLQLANFWQDVARDFAIGRIYLPREDYERFGMTRADFEQRTETPAFLDLMRFEVDRAQEWLTAGLPLVSQMPGRMQIDIELFARGGLKILERIEQINYHVWRERPKVTKRDAAGLLLRAVWRKFTGW